MLTNTTTRCLLSLTRGREFLPGEAIDLDPATLPEWDAVRRAFDRGELGAVVSVPPPASPVEVEPVAESLGDDPVVDDWDAMGKPALWKLIKDLGGDAELDYRRASAEDMRAFLRGL